jgi:hypothetical protein
MMLTAQDLQEKPVVFALAQKPHKLNPDEFIATLWPLMCFSTGEPVDASASSFPSKGYARWYRVPSGDWKHGDLVIGTLRRNEKGYNIEDKEWFQIFGDAGGHAGGRVCELFDLAEPIAKLSNLLRRPVGMKRIPSGDVYFRCPDAVAGPFRIEQGVGARSSNVYFTPERRAEGDVDVFDREAFDAAVIPIVRANAVLSLTEYMPTYARGDIYQTTYQIFRKQDLDRALLEKHAKYFLTDELLVTKACKQMRDGHGWRRLRDELKPLVALLENDSQGVSEAVIQGLPALLGEVEQRIATIEPLVEAIMQDETIAERIRQKEQAVVEAKVRARTEAIEQEAKTASASKVSELQNVEKEIEAVRMEKAKLLKELKTLRKQHEQNESLAEELIARVDERLRNGRIELISDLALIAPLLQNHQATPSSSNSHLVVRPNETTTNDRDATRQVSLSEKSIPKSLALSEAEFVEKRLWPMMNRHGAGVNLRDAEVFHASIVATRLMDVPHPGWASGYAAAMGETARCVTIAASPRWIDFDSAFRGSFLANWQSAVEDHQRLHLIVLEGIDRCPTHAWLRPWLNILAGWSTSLPDDQQTGWPDYVHLCVTEEKSPACFELPNELRRWVLALDSPTEPESIVDPINGHLPLETWRLEATHSDESVDAFVKSLELPLGDPCTPMKSALADRLRGALMRLRPYDPPMAIEQVIAKRLFKCWQPEGEA